MKEFQRNARRLRAPPNLLLRPSPVAGVQGRTSRHVRPRELILGQLLIFGSIFYEANEPSSACRLWRISQVETSTPPSFVAPLTCHEGRCPSSYPKKDTLIN